MLVRAVVRTGGNRQNWLCVTKQPDDIALIQHSAGTTGLQKGVALTHRAVLTQLRYLADALHIDGEDRIYIAGFLFTTTWG